MTLRHVTGRRAVHEKVRMPDGSVRYKCDLCNVALTSNQGGHSVDKKSCMLENLKIPKSFPNFGGQNLKILRMVYSLIETNKDRTQETCGGHVNFASKWPGRFDLVPDARFINVGCHVLWVGAMFV